VYLTRSPLTPYPCQAVTAAAWAANGSDVLCGCTDGTVKLFSSDEEKGGKFTEATVWDEVVLNGPSFKRRNALWFPHSTNTLTHKNEIPP